MDKQSYQPWKARAAAAEARIKELEAALEVYASMNATIRAQDARVIEMRDRIAELEAALRGMLEAMAMGTVEVVAKYGPDAHPDEPLIDAAHKARAVLERPE